MCTVTWNGTVYTVDNRLLKAKQVLDRFLREHPGIATHQLRLFSEGGVELDPEDSVWEDDELVLRARVIH